MRLFELDLGEKQEIKLLQTKKDALKNKKAKLENEQQTYDIKYPKVAHRNKAIAAKIKEITDFLDDQKNKLQIKIDQIDQQIQDAIQQDKNQFIQYLETILPECSEAVTEIKKAKTFLFRGSTNGKYNSYKKQNSDIFKGMPRSNRRAMDSPDEMQTIYDEMLVKYGFIALRSNSIFCSGNISHAEEYGNVYIIFPKNGFAYTWNKTSRDSELVWEEDFTDTKKVKAYEKAINQLIREFRKQNTRGYPYIEPWDYTETPNYNLDNIREEIGSKIDLPETLKSVSASDFYNFKKIHQVFKPINTNLAECLKAPFGHEVWIHGEYYAFSVKAYGEQIAKYFKFDGLAERFELYNE